MERVVDVGDQLANLRVEDDTAAAGTASVDNEAELSFLLLDAADRGDLERVRSLVERGASVYSRDDNGDMPIKRAADAGHLPVVEFLTAVDPLSVHGCWPTNSVVVNGHAHVLEFLFAHGLDINASDDSEPSPLTLALYSNQLQVLQCLLDHGADIYAELAGGNSLLHFAVSLGNAAAARVLLAGGVAVDARDNDGATPLHTAATCGFVEVMTLLLETGGDVYALTHDGASVTDYAASGGQLHVLHFLQARGLTAHFDKHDTPDAKVTPLTEAAEAGSLETVRFLVDYQSALQVASPDASALATYHRKNRLAALSGAVREGQLDVVVFLCESGASADNAGALAQAAESGQLDIVEYLIEKQRADVTHRTRGGLSALHLAASQGHGEAVALLLASGAAVDEEVDDCTPDVAPELLGMTAVHFAARHGSVGVLEMLLRHGANLHARTLQGLGVLEFARSSVSEDRFVVADFLVTNGVEESSSKT